MHLKIHEIFNWKNVTVPIVPGALNVITGVNGDGKTSVLAALQALLTRNSNPSNVRKKGMYGRTGAYAVLRNDEGGELVRWEPLDEGVTSSDDSVSTGEIAAGFGVDEFFSSSPTTRMAAFNKELPELRVSREDFAKDIFLCAYGKGDGMLDKAVRAALDDTPGDIAKEPGPGVGAINMVGIHEPFKDFMRGLIKRFDMTSAEGVSADPFLECAEMTKEEGRTWKAKWEVIVGGGEKYGKTKAGNLRGAGDGVSLEGLKKDKGNIEWNLEKDIERRGYSQAMIDSSNAAKAELEELRIEIGDKGEVWAGLNADVIKLMGADGKSIKNADFFYEHRGQGIAILNKQGQDASAQIRMLQGQRLDEKDAALLAKATDFLTRNEPKLKRLEAAKKEVEERRIKIYSDLERVDGAETKCPGCGIPLLVIGDKVTKHDPDKVAELEEARKAADEEEAKIRKGVTSIYKAKEITYKFGGKHPAEEVDVRIASHKEVLARIEKARKMIDEMGGEIDYYNDKYANLEEMVIDDKDIKSSKQGVDPEELRLKLEGINERIARQEIYEQAGCANRMVRNLINVLDRLKPQGMRQELYQGALDRLEKEANEWGVKLGFFEEGSVGVEFAAEDFSTTFRGIPYNMCSSSEQWRTRMLLQLVFAIDGGDNYMLLDHGDILDIDSYEEFKDAIAKCCADNELTLVLGATGDYTEDVPQNSYTFDCSGTEGEDVPEKLKRQ